jgi:hypothetical protein
MAQIKCHICFGDNCELAAKSCMELLHSLQALKCDIDTHRAALLYANEFLQKNKESSQNADHVQMCFQNQTLLFNKKIEMHQRMEHIKHYKEGLDCEIEGNVRHSCYIGDILKIFESRPTHECPSNGSIASP